MPLNRFVWEIPSKTKHIVPTHPSTLHPPPPAGIKQPYLSCPFRRRFKRSFDAMRLTSKEIAADVIRNSVAEDSLLPPPPPQKHEITGISH